MKLNSAGFLTKLRWSVPWMVRYPLWRVHERVRRLTETDRGSHLIFVVANHFEPGWDNNGGTLPLCRQLSRLDRWCDQARAIGSTVRDTDGTPFRHTYFYPAEQYHPPLLERLSELQREGMGEVEIHLHHGVGHPDNARNLRRVLVRFRDLLAEVHGCLSRLDSAGCPMYAFVHGNLALANSAGGQCCGVDSEMQILAETGCYADMTLPSAPHRSQVSRLNAIYECGRPLSERSPHRSGPGLCVGEAPKLPILFTGPLVFDWRRRLFGVPTPRLDGGALAAGYPLDLERLHCWRSTRIGVRGRPEWVFIKLFCHGFFPSDQPTAIGEPMRRFLEEVLELGRRNAEFKVYFATAREAFNIIMAAIDGQSGEPGLYRDYRLRPIMASQA